MMKEKRVCRRCLAKELPDASYYQNMYDYIAGLDEDIRASEEEYKQRLLMCRDCENLMEGMCRVCGCFVEMRAAVRKNYCPGLIRRW